MLLFKTVRPLVRTTLVKTTNFVGFVRNCFGCPWNPDHLQITQRLICMLLLYKTSDRNVKVSFNLYSELYKLYFLRLIPRTT